MVAKIKSWWAFFEKIPFGKWVFSRFLGMIIPYSGTIRPKILNIYQNEAQVCIKEHRRISNHLNSIHAIALINLGELTTGLALHFALGPNQKAILTNLTARYIKKARGMITASAKLDSNMNITAGEYKIVARLKNQEGDEVALVTAIWLVR